MVSEDGTRTMLLSGGLEHQVRGIGEAGPAGASVPASWMLPSTAATYIMQQPVPAHPFQSLLKAQFPAG